MLSKKSSVPSVSFIPAVEEVVVEEGGEDELVEVSGATVVEVGGVEVVADGVVVAMVVEVVAVLLDDVAGTDVMVLVTDVVKALGVVDKEVGDVRIVVD